MDSVPGSGRSPGGGNGSPLQYSCLENPHGQGSLRATVHGVAKCPRGLERLSARAHALLGAKGNIINKSNV